MHYQRHMYAARGPEYRAERARKQREYMQKPGRKERHGEYLRETKRGWPAGLVDSRRKQQGGRCAMCGQQMVVGGRAHNSEAADHYEEDGKKYPRALLCSTCNKSLGLYEGRQRHVGFVISQYDEYIARYHRENGTGGIDSPLGDGPQQP